MRPIDDTFREALKHTHKRVTRVSSLDSSFRTIATLSGEDGYAVHGSVIIDRRRPIQRTCTFSIANPEGIWTPRTASDFFAWGNLIRIERGIYIGGVANFVDLGVFNVDSPSSSIERARSILNVQGQDRMKRGAKSKFSEPTTYATSTRIQAVILDMCEDAGLGSTMYALDDGGKTLAAARTYDTQEERMKAMFDLARDYSLELRVDALGRVVLAPIVSLEQRPTVWTFTPGEDAVMLGITKDPNDDEFYNHVVVTGEAADLTPVRAEASDTNPASPTWIGGPAGDRTYFYTSAMIRTTLQAQEVANAMLPEVMLVEEAIRMPIIVNPALEAGDAIAIAEPVTDTNDRYLIDSINIPLGEGSSTVQTKKLRSLAA